MVKMKTLMIRLIGFLCLIGYAVCSPAQATSQDLVPKKRQGLKSRRNDPKQECISYNLLPSEITFTKFENYRLNSQPSQGGYLKYTHIIRLSRNYLVGASQNRENLMEDWIFRGIQDGLFSTNLIIQFNDEMSLQSMEPKNFQTLFSSQAVQINPDKQELIIIISRELSTLASESGSPVLDPDAIYFYVTSNVDTINESNIDRVTFYIYEESKRDTCNLDIAMPPDLKLDFTGDTFEYVDNGVKGQVRISVGWNNGYNKELSLEFEKVEHGLATRLCNAMGYMQSKKIKSNIRSNQGFFDIDDEPCRNLALFYADRKMYEYNRLYANRFKDIEMTKFCEKKYGKNKKKNKLELECTNPMTTTISLAQFTNTCNGSNNCAFGYHYKDGLCVPNVCHCYKGNPAESDYNYLSNTCGLVFSEKEDDNNDAINLNSRMIGGSEITRTDMPFQAYLYITNDKDAVPHCSSAIINPKFVLTAAHCCYLKSRTLKKIYVTESFIPGTPIIHKHYKQPTKDDFNDFGMTKYDIALVEIKSTQKIGAKNLRFSKTIRPICLSDEVPVAAESTVYATGRNKDNGKFNVLEMEILDFNNCSSQSYLHERQYSDDLGFLCATASTGSSNKDQGCMTITKGDSGGPLMRKKVDFFENNLVERWELIGIVSAGLDCSVDNNQPFTLFTNVHHYLEEWIRGIIEQDNQDGRFCAIDDTIDCYSCDEGYSLKGKSCIGDFNTDSLNSLTDFFDGNYCSDLCTEFMTCENDTTAAPNSNSPSNGLKVTYKECLCTNGMARKRCRKNLTGPESIQIENCHPEKCFNEYRYNEITGQCQYFGDNTMDFDFITSYLLQDCPEENKKQIIGDRYCGRLFLDHFNICTFRKQYYLDCIKDICPKNIEKWPEEVCRKLADIEQQCLADIRNNLNTGAAISIPETLTWRSDDFCPSSCATNYHKANSLCMPNICTCANGQAVPNSKCTEHDSNQCQSCDSNYHIQEEGDKPKICKANICQCDNGQQVPNSECTENGDNQCRSCNDGFTLSKYEAINAETDFTGAVKLCQDYGMKIAKIKTEKDGSMVKSTFNKIYKQTAANINLISPAKSFIYYIGLKKIDGYPYYYRNSFFWLQDDDKESTLGDVDHQISNTYNNWGTDEQGNIEPNDSGGFDMCVVVNYDNRLKTVKWSDLNCDEDTRDASSIGVLCQFESAKCVQDDQPEQSNSIGIFEKAYPIEGRYLISNYKFTTYPYLTQYKAKQGGNRENSFNTDNDKNKPGSTWILEKSPNDNAGYSIFNAEYQGYRLAMSKGPATIVWKSNCFDDTCTDMVWYFERLGNYYRIWNKKYSDRKLFKWSESKNSVGTDNGELEDYQLWSLIPNGN